MVEKKELFENKPPLRISKKKLRICEAGFLFLFVKGKLLSLPNSFKICDPNFLNAEAKSKQNIPGND